MICKNFSQKLSSQQNKVKVFLEGITAKNNRAAKMKRHQKLYIFNGGGGSGAIGYLDLNIYESRGIVDDG